MAAKKAARKPVDPHIPLWAESMVPELTKKQADVLDRAMTAHIHCANYEAKPLELRDAEAMEGFGVFERVEGAKFRLTPAGEYVYNRLKEMGWL